MFSECSLDDEGGNYAAQQCIWSIQKLQWFPGDSQVLLITPKYPQSLDYLLLWRILNRSETESLLTDHIPNLDAIKMNSMKTLPTQVFLVSVLLWSVFFFFINEILVLHSSLAALKEKIADGFTFKIIVYILGGFLMAYISRYIKRRENTTKINKWWTASSKVYDSWLNALRFWLSSKKLNQNHKAYHEVIY